MNESSLCAGHYCPSLTYRTNFLASTFPLGCGFKSSGWCNKLLPLLSEVAAPEEAVHSFKARGDHYNNFTCHALETKYIIQNISGPDARLLHAGYSIAPHGYLFNAYFTSI